MTKPRTLKLAPGLDLPVDAVTQRIALLARTGAGKTYAAGVLVEELLDVGAVVAVIDPLGVWWGLKSSADGKREGYPVLVMGSAHGDLPLDPHAGAFLAKWFVESRISTVFSLVGFGENAMKQFVADFLAEFYRLQLLTPSPVHLVVDEADEFAPQSASMGGAAGKCLSAMQNVVRRGRVGGIGTSLISQRSAAIAKSVLTQTELMIALQTTSPQDLDAIEGWIKHAGDPARAKEILAALPRMKPGTGEAMVYSPSWLGKLEHVQIRKKRTFDSSRTPKVGEKVEPPKKLAQLDLSALAGEMTKYAEDAKANDPVQLKRRIADLERELRSKKSGASDEQVQDAVNYAVAAAGQLFLEALAGPVGDLEKALAAIRAVGARAAPSGKALSREVAKASPPRRSVSAETSTGSATLAAIAGSGSVKDKLLAVLAAFHPEIPDAETHALLAGTTLTSSTRGNALTALKNEGLIESSSSRRITPAGLDRAKNVPPIPQPGPELVAFWRATIGGGVAERIFDALVETGDWWEASELAAKVGSSTTSSTFGNALTKFNKRRLLEKQPGRYRLNPAILG